MRRSRKITIVLGILGLGGLGAMPFLRPEPKTASAIRPAKVTDLPLRGVPLHVSTQPGTSPAGGLYDDDSASSGPADKALDPAQRFPAQLDQFGPPPDLSSSYPTLLEPVEAWTARAGTDAVVPRLGGSVRTASAESNDAVRKHRLIDGDTLAKLARRYLGDANRAAEIYEANRDALANPSVLPLGVEIVIPPR